MPHPDSADNRSTTGKRARVSYSGSPLGIPEPASAYTRTPLNSNDSPASIRLAGAVRGCPAWLSGPAGEGLEAFESIASLPALIRALASTSEEELIASRAQARTLLDGLQAVSRAASAFALTENPIGLATWEAVGAWPAAPAWLTAFTVAIRHSARYDDNLQTILTALDSDILPIDGDVRELAQLSEEELRERLPNLERMPFIDQARIRNLLAKHRRSG